MPRIAHLSDIHFGGENTEAVEGARAWLARESPDLIVITGDLTAFGRPDEFERAAAWAATLTAPLLVTPGNHDTPYLGLVERLAAPFARYERGFGPSEGPVWSDPTLTAVTVNTARGAQWRWNWSKGAVGRRQTGRALDQLGGRAAGALAVVACHHPLVEMVGGPMTGRVRGGEAAARRLCAGGVDVVLTGHIHAPFVMAYPYADGHAYAVGAGTLSRRERGVPAGFNLIEADAARLNVTALAWTGSRFETWRTWSEPRRAAG
ncbi:MAG: metallophosphoesterase [Caulobacteraceae bacterium]